MRCPRAFLGLIVCAAFVTPCRVTRGAEGPAESGGSPEEAKAAKAAKAIETPQEPARMERIFEYIEDIEITDGDSRLKVSANVLVLTTTERDTVTVEIRPGVRKDLTDEKDPPLDKVTVFAGSAGGRTEWDLPALRVVFKFAPWEKGSVSVRGLNVQAFKEASMILGQGPTTNPLHGGARGTYKITLQSAGAPFTIDGEQLNGDLWVDWMLSGRGTLKVGGRGWQMPVDFVLPEKGAGKRGMKIRAKASMRYSSVRPGPEDETTLETVLSYPLKRGGELVYRRSCKLRPIVLGLDKETPPGKSRLPANADLCGRAGLWARAATLATLGVQRLAGVRETGLAMWVAQISIDSIAGREVPRSTDKAARRRIADVARFSPTLEPPPGSSEADIGRKSVLSVSAGMNVLPLTAKFDKAATSAKEGGVGFVPDLSISLLRKVGERWRLGVGIDGMWLDTNTEDPQELWQYVAVVGRIEYAPGNWRLRFSGGVGLVTYDMKSTLGWAMADLMATSFSFELEWRVRRRFGFGLKYFRAWDNGGLELEGFQPVVRWRSEHGAALEIRLAQIRVSDAGAAVGEISAEGVGVGTGIVVRW